MLLVNESTTEPFVNPRLNGGKRKRSAVRDNIRPIGLSDFLPFSLSSVAEQSNELPSLRVSRLRLFEAAEGLLEHQEPTQGQGTWKGRKPILEERWARFQDSPRNN